MNIFRRSFFFVGLALFCSVAAHAAQEAAAPPVAPSLSAQEMEVFLKNAKVVKIRSLGQGVTNSRVATLSDGRITHEAHVQTVDVAMPVFQAGANSELNFKDAYRFNIAAYHVAVLLGMNSVPMSVERRVEGKLAAVTWWVDDVLMDEKKRTETKASSPDPVAFSRQRQIMRIFDELIRNVDRNQGNMIYGKDWKLWLIDHSRAFRLTRELKKPDDLDRCDRTLLESLRRLTLSGLMEAAGSSLTKSEAEAVIARRDLIVKHFDERITKIGEAAVLFTTNEVAGLQPR